jgi:hypothetical protein
MPVTMGKIEELARHFRGEGGVSLPPLIERSKGARSRRSSRSACDKTSAKASGSGRTETRACH